jgi:hypothetical protein
MSHISNRLTPLASFVLVWEAPLSSGRADSNRRPLDPQSSALTKLRHGPYAVYLGVYRMVVPRWGRLGATP